MLKMRQDINLKEKNMTSIQNYKDVYYNLKLLMKESSLVSDITLWRKNTAAEYNYNEHLMHIMQLRQYNKLM
jgi:hypothetical protein